MVARPPGPAAGTAELVGVSYQPSVGGKYWIVSHKNLKRNTCDADYQFRISTATVRFI